METAIWPQLFEYLMRGSITSDYSQLNSHFLATCHGSKPNAAASNCSISSIIRLIRTRRNRRNYPSNNNSFRYINVNIWPASNPCLTVLLATGCDVTSLIQLLKPRDKCNSMRLSISRRINGGKLCWRVSLWTSLIKLKVVLCNIEKSRKQLITVAYVEILYPVF